MKLSRFCSGSTGLVFGLVASLFLSACGTPSGRAPATPSGSSSPKADPAAPVPADPSPNILRDRRAEAGVRAPAKSLVMDGARSVKCGKLTKGAAGAEVDLLAGRL